MRGLPFGSRFLVIARVALNFAMSFGWLYFAQFLYRGTVHARASQSECNLQWGVSLLLREVVFPNSLSITVFVVLVILLKKMMQRIGRPKLSQLRFEHIFGCCISSWVNIWGRRIYDCKVPGPRYSRHTTYAMFGMFATSLVVQRGCRRQCIPRPR